MGRIPQALAVTVVLGLLGLLVWDLAHDKGGISKDVNAGKTVPAPQFDRPRLDTDGKLSLASLRGKVVVLNVWASWCIPCKGEAPVLEAGAKRWAKKGVVFVGVNHQDLKSRARAFMARYGMDYPVISGTEGMISDYGVIGVPKPSSSIGEDGLLPHIIGRVTRDTLDEGIRRALKA